MSREGRLSQKVELKGNQERQLVPWTNLVKWLVIVFLNRPLHRNITTRHRPGPSCGALLLPLTTRRASGAMRLQSEVHRAPAPELSGFSPFPRSKFKFTLRSTVPVNSTFPFEETAPIFHEFDKKVLKFMFSQDFLKTARVHPDFARKYLANALSLNPSKLHVKTRRYAIS
jgi:hypothetical protein